MAWVAREPVEMSARRALIVEWDRAWNERTNFTMGIFDGDTLVGGTGLHVRGHPGVLEIGYWVRADRVRTGIATRIVEVLVRSAFEIDDVEAVEIHHDVANIASGMVPEKAGFTFDREYDRPCEAPGDCGRGRAWITRRVR